MWALYAREVKRFQKLLLDTIFTPIVTLVLYLAVFGVVLGGKTIGGQSSLAFIYSGLLSMIMVNSSFSNPSFAIIISKNLGSFIDLQLAPIKAWKIGLSYALAALTRAVLTLILATVLTIWFIPISSIHNIALLLVSILLTGVEFGMLGVVFGMYAKNFEALTIATTFILQPMIFLAGSFYPVSTLPYPWSIVSAFNPLHHNVNLFRYALMGYSDGNPWISLAVIIGLSLVLFVAMHFITKRSIRGKS